MLQNAIPLRKSALGPPKSSDEHVSCTAPAAENASLQILFKCPTPAIVFGNATKPSRFAHFWPGAQSLAPATKRHLNVKKWSGHVFSPFWLRNVLRATAACTFSTSCVFKLADRQIDRETTTTATTTTSTTTQHYYYNYKCKYTTLHCTTLITLRYSTLH